jgi:streptogramin lyase
VITTGTNLLSSPYDLAFTLKGKLLTADYGNDNIVQIDPGTGHEAVAFPGAYSRGLRASRSSHRPKPSAVAATAAAVAAKHQQSIRLVVLGPIPPVGILAAHQVD